jgi:DNA polymerase elongation subunit (family B)
MPGETSSIPFVAIDFENVGRIEGLTASFECAYAYGQIRKFRRPRNGDGRQKFIYTIEDFEMLFTTREQVLDWIRNLKKVRNCVPCHIVMFNASYDYPFMRGECNDEKLLMNSQFIMGETKNGIKIWDIQRHATTGSLGDWMERLNLQEKGIVKKSLDDKQARCRDDARATWELAMYFKETYNAMGINMKSTMPSTALSYFQHKYMMKDSETPLIFERIYEEWGEFVRKSYYGGRSEVFSRGLQICYWYDINSTYVSVMRDELLPDPQFMRNVPVPKDNWRQHYDGYDGVFDVTVEVPMCHYPPLPVRTPEDKLIFPVGTFRGVWTTVDLKAAETQGTKILECHRYIWYEKSIPVMREFAEECWNNRQLAVKTGGKGCVDEIFWKTFGNALYGKLAQRIPIDGYVGKMTQYKGELPEVPKYWEDEDGQQYISVTPTIFEESKFAFVELSSFIAAYARRKLMEAIWALEKEGLVTTYVDTDSIKVTTRKQEINDAIRAKIESTIKVSDKNLGDWKYEGEPDVFFFRPKWYAEVESRGTATTPPVLNLKSKNTKTKGVGKRATITALNWSQREDGEWTLDDIQAEDERPYRMKESVHRDKAPNFWRTVKKTLVNDDTKRMWFGDDSIPLIWKQDEERALTIDEIPLDLIDKGL